jgi:hypothetical protein
MRMNKAVSYMESMVEKLKSKLSNPNVHKEFFNLGKLTIGFIVTFVLTNIFALAPQEAKIVENYEVAKVQVEYLKSSKATDSLKLAIADAKLKSAEHAKKNYQSLAGFAKELINSGMKISAFFWFFGLLFWFNHVPNKPVNQD